MDYVKLFESVACKEDYMMAEGVEAVVKQVRIDTLVNLRNAIQPDGLINSEAGIKTIESITLAITGLIENSHEIRKTT